MPLGDKRIVCCALIKMAKVGWGISPLLPLWSLYPITPHSLIREKKKQRVCLIFVCVCVCCVLLTTHWILCEGLGGLFVRVTFFIITSHICCCFALPAHFFLNNCMLHCNLKNYTLQSNCITVLSSSITLPLLIHLSYDWSFLICSQCTPYVTIAQFCLQILISSP